MEKIENFAKGIHTDNLQSRFVGIIYILFLFLFTQTIFVYTQSILWQRIYQSPSLLLTIDVSIADSGNFYLINREYNGPVDNTRIIKINAFGDTLWNRLDLNMPASAVSSGDGGCVITFIYVGPMMYAGKINSSGNFVWYKTYENYSTPYKIIKSSSNTYLICGQWGGGEGTIMEIDSIGNEIWQKLYPGGFHKIYYSICEANNGGYVAVGILVGSSSDYGYGVIDRIDSAGNLLWEKTYSQNGSGTQFNAIDKCPGGYILGGQARDSSANLNGIYIIKIDTSGNKVFSKFISANDTNHGYGFGDLSTINNNKFIIYCGFGDTNFYYPKLIIADFNGNIIDSNTIQTNSAFFFRGITINNNEFIAVGAYDNSIFGYGYAVRFDTNLYVPPIGIKKIAKNVPVSFQLYQNYPNPFNPTTKIKFEIPASHFPSKGGAMIVTLKIYDILGREVASLIPPLWGGQEGLKPGSYEVTWDGSKYASGIYFYRITISNPDSPSAKSSGFVFSETKKLVLLK